MVKKIEKTEKREEEVSDQLRKYYFVSGMPRSGSTLLCNILAQNPRFHTTGTNGIMDVMFGVRNSWDKLVEFQTAPNEPAKLRVLRGIFENFYSDVSRPVIFDKCRGWLSLLEMAEAVLGHKAKVLVPVRDMRDVLASFEKLWRETSKTAQVGQESQFYFDFQTVQGRTNVWLRADQPVGLAYNRIVDAVNRGYLDRMLFVDFDDLTMRPKETFKRIYDFLGEPLFEHNFNHVEQVTWEDDSVHGFKGLHNIRHKVEPMKPQWPHILGEWSRSIEKYNFWKTGRLPDRI